MIMNKNRAEGTKHEVKGAIKEVAGKVTGNKVKEATGYLPGEEHRQGSERSRQGIRSRARRRKKALISRAAN